MNRLRWLTVLCGMVLATGAKAAPPPNIIYILADDLGYGDLSCLGQEHFQTPNIDALKWKGVRYNVLKNPNEPIKLFDLSVDPGEQSNVVDQHPETVEQIRKIMTDARTHSEVFTFGRSPDTNNPCHLYVIK